jgi:hypothetical protein
VIPESAVRQEREIKGLKIEMEEVILVLVVLFLQSQTRVLIEEILGNSCIYTA